MAKVGAQRAAELTGKSKSTIQRSMNNGKLSYEMDTSGRRVIDVSELERVFGLEKAGTTSVSAGVEQELEKAKQMLEFERMKMQMKALQDQLDAANEQIADLKGQRDKWQKQADQVLITSQYSQKQAEEFRNEVKEREKRAQERRQKMLDDKMKKMQANNENSVLQGAPAGEAHDDTVFQGLWKKVKGER